MFIFSRGCVTVFLGGWARSKIIYNFFQSFKRTYFDWKNCFLFNCLTSTSFPWYSASFLALSQNKKKKRPQKWVWFYLISQKTSANIHTWSLGKILLSVMRLDCISESNAMLLFPSFHGVIPCYSNQKVKKTKQRPTLKQ